MESIQKLSHYIEDWLTKYIKKSKMKGFVVGVSGGIDSAVTSTICARTGYPTLCLEMGIHQNISQISKARKLVCSQARPDEMEDVYKWLYDNVELFGDEEKQESAILIIKQGLVDHTLVSDPEINLAATMIRLSRMK